MIDRILRRARDRIAFAKIAANFLRATVTVRVRRRVKGPVRAGWSERYESLVEMLRRDTNALRPLDAAQIRARMTSPLRSPALERVRVEVARDAPIASTWITANGEEPRGTMLYLHGGGYVCGSPHTHSGFLARVATKTRLRVLAVDYRLAPEHPFPCAIDDAVESYRWLVGKHTSADRIIVAGDSAGGGLTMATLVTLRDAREPLPAGAVLISPWVDLSGSMASLTSNARFDWIDEDFLRRCARDYLGARDRNDPRASPLHADLRGLPPFLVQIGGAEILLDEARALSERARAAGVDAKLEVTDDMVHVWPMFADLVPEGKHAIDRLAHFVDERLSRRDEARVTA